LKVVVEGFFDGNVLGRTTKVGTKRKRCVKGGADEVLEEEEGGEEDDEEDILPQRRIVRHRERGAQPPHYLP
jgi:hypothetical protein